VTEGPDTRLKLIRLAEEVVQAQTPRDGMDPSVEEEIPGLRLICCFYSDKAAGFANPHGFIANVAGWSTFYSFLAGVAISF
jgi:hypothetical protein